MFPIFVLLLLCPLIVVNAQTQAALCSCLESPVTLNIPNVNTTYHGNANRLNGEAIWVFHDDGDAFFTYHNVSLKVCASDQTSNLIPSYIDRLRVVISDQQTVIFQQTVSIVGTYSSITHCFTGSAQFIDAGSESMPRVETANPAVFTIIDDRGIALAPMYPEAPQEVYTASAPPTPIEPFVVASGTTSPPTSATTTTAPTTQAPTTAPTTSAPTSSTTTTAPTTPAPTTQAPTTAAPTTATTTQAPTTRAPTTTAPTTAPTTQAPTTPAPTTQAPTTPAPTTQAPTTPAPTTPAPTTQAPTTPAPTTQAPTTPAPTTQAPTTLAPTTAAPTTPAPTTQAPTTAAPTSATPPAPFWQLTYTAANEASKVITGSQSGTLQANIVNPVDPTQAQVTIVADPDTTKGYVIKRNGTEANNVGKIALTGTGKFIPTTYSKSVWVRLNTLGATHCVIASNWVLSGTHYMQTKYPTFSDGKFKFGHGSSGNALTANTGVVVNTWTHLVVTYDEATTTMKIYVNGVLDATDNTIAAFVNGNTPEDTQIGDCANGGQGLQGYAYKPAIYSVALNSAQVLTIYNTG